MPASANLQPWPSLFRRCILYFVIGLLISVVIVILFIARPEPLSYEESFKIFSHLRDAIRSQALLLGAASFLFTAVGVFFVALLYSHRIAGPLYRLRSTCSLCIQKDLSGSTSLRHKDALTPLAKELGQFLDRHRQAFLEIKKQTEKAQTTIDQMHNVDCQSLEQLAQITHKIDEILDTLQPPPPPR